MKTILRRNSRRAVTQGCALLAATLLPAICDAGLALDINGSTSSVTVNGGDALNLAWAATSDITSLARQWDGSTGTALPGLVGGETIHAPNPTESTAYLYTISGYDAAFNYVQASVQVNVNSNPNANITPVTWTPSLGFQIVSPLSFYVVPDALIGSPYSATISATGNGPVTFSAVGLPDGLSIVGNTIVGTPTTNALLDGGNFTLIATDADGFSYPTLARMLTPVLAPRVLPAVTAPVVFDGGAPTLDNAYDNDIGFNQERAMSGFMLKADSTVTSVRVWGTYLRRFKAANDSFTIKFYDRGASPLDWTWPSFPAAGALISTFMPSSVTRTATGRASFGVPNSEFMYDLGFSGITLKSNTLYYVSVVNNTQEEWGWESAAVQNYPSWGAWSQDGGATFPGGSAELAFQLREGPIAPPTPTPTNTVPATYKLDIKKNGKGTVTFTPNGSGSSATAFTPGTVVTLTATPDATDKTSVWKGWTGDVTSANRTISVTMSKNVTVQANFR